MTDDINDQPPLDQVQVWRDRLARFKAEQAADYARRNLEEQQPSPLSPETQAMLRVVARNIAREVNMAKAELRAEIEVLRVHMQRAVEMTRQPRRRKQKRMS
jgi:hypothetical protein